MSNADRQKRYRERQRNAQGVTDGNGNAPNSNAQTVTRNAQERNVTPTVTRPDNYGQQDCQCQHCQANRRNGSSHTINHGPYKTAAELGPHELNRVTLPGDSDYEAQADPPITPQGAGVGRENTLPRPITD